LSRFSFYKNLVKATLQFLDLKNVGIFFFLKKKKPLAAAING